MEGALAVGLVLSGRVSEGIKFLESAIAARDADGFRSMAAWNRITLAEIYLEILTARERPPMHIIVKNLWTFLASMLFGARRAEELLEKAAAHTVLVCASARRQIAGLAEYPDAWHERIARQPNCVRRDVSQETVFWTIRKGVEDTQNKAGDRLRRGDACDA
jgi:hypothetical protein